MTDDMLPDGRHAGIDPARYHALPGLSPTGAVRLLVSPRAYRYARVDETPAMRLGTAIHEIALGDPARVRALPDVSARSREGRAALEQARADADGALLIPAEDYERATASASAARRALRWLYREDPQAVTAEHEVSMVWRHGTRRGRPDILSDEDVGGSRRLVVADLKTTHAMPADIASHVARAGWHTQLAGYVDGATQTGAGHVVDCAAYIVAAYIVLVETVSPYDALVIRLAPDYLELGADAWTEAGALYDQCITDAHWPYRGELAGVQTVSAPRWARRPGLAHDD